MKKILIISPHQLGELMDSYYWAKYSTELGYDITYLGYKYKNNTNRNYIQDDSFKQICIQRDKNYFLFAIDFFLTIFKTIILHNFQNIIVVNFPFCKILPKLFPNRNIIFDIRTISVANEKETRQREDTRIQQYAKAFKKVSIISEGAAKHLNISNYNLLPLGAISLTNKTKDFKSLKFLYIGTFNNRNLDVLIQGISKFYKKYQIPFSVDFIGGGNQKVEKKLKELVITEKLENYITFHGFLNHQQAKPYFEKCNIGLSYIPITSYYENQPPTKTFEYLLSGMFCIATQTESNKKIITKENGILTKDSADDICESLKKASELLSSINSTTIKNSAKEYHWEKIVSKYFIPLFN